MFVVSRFRYRGSDAARALDELGTCLAGLSVHDGYVDGKVGRALDDPEIWVLVTIWRGVGHYRRALSSYDIKLRVVPLLARAIDEPSAYEELAGDLATEPNDWATRGEPDR